MTYTLFDASILEMVSKFLISCISKRFWEFFSTNVKCCCILAFFVNCSIFFVFKKIVTFVAYSLKELQNLFIQSSPRYKVCLFSILSKAHIVDIEYSQESCLPIFGVKDFSGLFAYPSIFYQKFKVSINNVWNFIRLYILNCNILSFRDGITIPPKSLFLHTYSQDFSSFSVLKEWREFER